KLLAITGLQHRTLDLAAATDLGIMVSHSSNHPGAHTRTTELPIGLILATIRRLPQEDRRTREGLWQGSVGTQVYGRTLGIVGLGKIGRRVARAAQALDMNVIAWSQNLTDA